MKTNARNQFTGIVKHIRNGDVGSEVTITLPGGHKLAAMITRESYNDLDLDVDNAVITLVKSTAVVITTGLEHIKLSARSRLDDLICEVGHGAASSMITMGSGSGLRLTAGVTLQNTEQFDLHPSQCVTTIFRTDGVVLGVLA